MLTWLEGFKAKFEQYQEAEATIEKCETVLSLYDSVAGAAKAQLDIQNAVNARRADGSNLEYGLEHHLDRFESALKKGVPADKRFPERANKYIADMGERQEALLTWLEGFKAKFKTQHAAATIDKCENVLSLYDSVVGAAKIPLEIQNAVNARRADGSNLEYGLEYHLQRFESALKKGVPADKRFPERAKK